LLGRKRWERRVSGRVVRVWKRLGKKARARRRMMRVVERAEVGVGDGGIFQWINGCG
jgi:hypothetical protein